MSPSVLFVCVKNGGKSQIAAALMRQLAGSSVEVLSAGTAPGGTVNAEARESVEQVGATMEGEYPKPIDPAVLARVDRVVVLGSQAHVEPVAGMHAPIEVWETDEPSLRGIEGAERMALIRDDIAARVRDLLQEMTGQPAGRAIRVYEPALCCNTGVCGPDVDQRLVAFTADLEYLRGLGVDISRHNLASDPAAFAAEPVLADYLRVVGSAGLPVVLADGVIVATGSYPDRAALLRLAGREGVEQASGRNDLGLTAVSGCCSGGSAEGSRCC